MKVDSTSNGHVAALNLQPDNIPQLLRSRPQWVMWGPESSFDKAPRQTNGVPASSTEPTTWAAFEECLATYQHGDWSGIGWVITPADDVTIFDFDHCRNKETGEIEEWARQAMEELDSYTEVSPSGTGLRIVCRGTRPDRERSKNGNAEVFDGSTNDGRPGGKYLTLTGHRLNQRGVKRRQQEIARVYRRLINVPSPAQAPATAPPRGPRDDLRVLHAAMEDGRLRDLWYGQSLHADASANDLALCCRLVRFCGPDPAQVDRLFRQSALMRAKWERQDYRDRTIAAALARVTTYSDEEELFTVDDTKTVLGGELPPVDYLIRDLLVRGQPCVLGGPEKCLKTWLVLDMAYSLASGEPFLGWSDFSVAEPTPVLIMSGESGRTTIHRNLRTITTSRSAFGFKIEKMGDRLHLVSDVPKFYDVRHMDWLSKYMGRTEGRGVVFIDTVSLAVKGDTGPNMMSMQEQLRCAGRVCEEHGWTLVIVHHTHSLKSPYRTLTLSDLAYAGFQQWARQWLLVSRRGEYEPPDGGVARVHQLFMTAGGSAGHSGVYGLDLSEGSVQRPVWRPRVKPMHKMREEQKSSRLEQNCDTILERLRSGPHAKRELSIGHAWQETEAALAELIKRGEIEVKAVTGGNGQNYDRFTLTARK